MDLSHILNWELKSGSHEFPGPSGGTCINEAAIVAAGFEYRAVKSAKDCPPCFCPVLSEFAIVVNDQLGLEDRQSLMMPLVTRLAGSRDDEAWVESARAEFIMREVYRGALGPLLHSSVARHRLFKGADVNQHVEGVWSRCEHHTELAFMNVHKAPTDALQAFIRAMVGAHGILGVVGKVSCLEAEIFTPVRLATGGYFAPPAIQVGVEVTRASMWRLAAQALTRAFRIGTQAPAADTAQVVERMEAVKTRARELAQA